MPETITLEMDRYKELAQKEAILDALYAWGVDNWDAYDDAIAHLIEDEDD